MLNSTRYNSAGLRFSPVPLIREIGFRRIREPIYSIHKIVVSFDLPRDLSHLSYYLFRLNVCDAKFQDSIFQYSPHESMLKLITACSRLHGTRELTA